MLPRPAHHFMLARLRAALQAQRVGLELRKPWTWPLAPQLALLVLVSALVLALVWIVLLQGYWQQWAAEQSREGDLRQDGKTLNLSGFALSNDRVSEFLRQLAQGSDWFSGPELVEVVAANLELPGRAPSRGANFTIRLRLEPAPLGSGAEPKAGALPAPLRKTLEPGA